MSSESKTKDSRDKSTGMVWDIIDLDTLSVGRSTPAFADSFSKDGSALTTEENPSSSNNNTCENSNIGSRLLSSLLSSKKLISAPKEPSDNRTEQAVVNDAFTQDSPNLLDSATNNSHEERKDDDGEAKSYQGDSRHGTSEGELSSDPSLIGFIVVDDREINTSTPISSFAFVNNDSELECQDVATTLSHSGEYSDLHDVQTPVLIDFDGDTDIQAEFIQCSTPNSDIVHQLPQETTSESLKVDDDSQSVTSAKDNRSSWEIYQEQLQLAREALKVSNKNGRCRSSSADEELTMFEYGTTSNNKASCSLKEDCRDSIDLGKSGLFSLFDYPTHALLKVKEIFFVFALGNALYDQKSPVPIIVSHALAFLVGAFVGRKLSLSLGSPSSGGSSIQNYLTSNSTNACTQRNDVPAIFA